MDGRDLEKALQGAQREAVALKKAIATPRALMDALRHASLLLNELRTSSLLPKQYYELFIVVCDSLEGLSAYLERSNTQLVDLYELVQYAGNILPRLYLMITVGSTLLKSKNSPREELINDMLEMCKGVQTPIRGLFLRYYLNQKTKDLLPIETIEEQELTVDFIITNFIEMNKLWVRLQFQGPLSEREKRQEEREELKVLVGSNLVRLSQMDFIDSIYYKEKILPLILEQIVKCNDQLAQSYLLDVIIQIFPDDFQIITIDLFLDCLLTLQKCNYTPILISLIDRLINYKKLDQGEFKAESLNSFISFINKIFARSPEEIKDGNMIINKIMTVSLTYFPDNFDNVNELFKLGSMNSTNSKDLLMTPLKSQIMNFFKLDDNYFDLFKSQKEDLRVEIMVEIIKSFIKAKVKIENGEDLSKLMKFLSCSILVTEEKPRVTETKRDLFGLDEPQVVPTGNVMDIPYEYLNKIFNLIQPSTPMEKFELIDSIVKEFKKGKFDLIVPTIVNVYLQIIEQLYNEDVPSDDQSHTPDDDELTKPSRSKEMIRIFTQISELINEVKTVIPYDCIELNLQSGVVSNNCGLLNITYEFFIESFIIYEELIIESKVQYRCIILIINHLIKLTTMIKYQMDDFDKLITKAAVYSSRLMRKTDQCRAVYQASHLWWIFIEEEAKRGDEAGPGADGTAAEEQEDDDDADLIMVPIKQDGKRVLECLQKSLRIADSIMDFNTKMELFIEILNKSVYYFIHGNEMINVKYLNGLIELIWNNFKEMGINGSSKDAAVSESREMGHFERTLKYIKDQRSIDARFLDLVLN